MVMNGIKTNKFSASKIKLKSKDKEKLVNKQLGSKIKDMMAGEEEIELDQSDFIKDKRIDDVEEEEQETNKEEEFLQNKRAA